MTLQETIYKAAQRDKKAQRHLFDMTHQHLMTVALRYIIDLHMAEDILQEAYIRIFQHLKRFEYINDSATMGWMRRLVATESIRHLKKQKKWDSMRVESAIDRPEQTDNPLIMDDLYKTLLHLSAEERVVFNMHTIEGYNHKEIAEHLSIAESSSRSLLTRARKKLQKLLIQTEAYEIV